MGPLDHAEPWIGDRLQRARRHAIGPVDDDEDLDLPHGLGERALDRADDEPRPARRRDHDRNPRLSRVRLIALAVRLGRHSQKRALASA
jgi:hypothetical protein